MIICNHCEGFIPEELSVCPNCESKIKNSIISKNHLMKIINGVTATSVAMTLMACYGAPPCGFRKKCDNTRALLILAELSRSVTIQFTGPKDLGNLKIYIGNQVIDVEPSKKSNSVIIYIGTGIYKIVDSKEKVLFENKNFNFSENIKDGVIIKEDFKLDFYKPNICYNLNGETGKVESFECY